jgi:hypothetical protein
MFLDELANQKSVLRQQSLTFHARSMTSEATGETISGDDDNEDVEVHYVSCLFMAFYLFMLSNYGKHHSCTVITQRAMNVFSGGIVGSKIRSTQIWILKDLVTCNYSLNMTLSF